MKIITSYMPEPYHVRPLEFPRCCQCGTVLVGYSPAHWWQGGTGNVSTYTCPDCLEERDRAWKDAMFDAAWHRVAVQEEVLDQFSLGRTW